MNRSLTWRFEKIPCQTGIESHILKAMAIRRWWVWGPGVLLEDVIIINYGNGWKWLEERRVMRANNKYWFDRE